MQVVQDRLTIGEETRARLIESIETAPSISASDRINGIAISDGGDAAARRDFGTGAESRPTLLRIPNFAPSTSDGIARIATSIFAHRLPGLFSFNNPLGVCPTCRESFGRTIAIDS